MSKVFLGAPLYDGRSEWLTCRAELHNASVRHEVKIFPLQSSLLPRNCTSLWGQALDLRDSDPSWEWFAMLHDDIVPEAQWIDKLIAIADEHGADFVSAVSPLKGDDGGCSTALARSDDEFTGVFNLMLGQVNHPEFPDVFDLHAAADALERLPEPYLIANVPRFALLANTGCMVCRMDRAWCDDVWFSTPCKMIRQNGKRVAIAVSEDFFFSRGIARAGGKVMVTRLVALEHYGRYAFKSRGVWGQPRDT